MPPKLSRSAANHDDSRSEAPPSRDRNAPPPALGHPNGKPRRALPSAAGGNARDGATAAPPAQGAPAVQEPPGISWPSMDRDTLHAYRRHFRLETPPSFLHDYHRLVLARPAGVGIFSPTMAPRRRRRRFFLSPAPDQRPPSSSAAARPASPSSLAPRQTRDQLAAAVRRHFNSVGVQENDAVAEFLQRVHADRAAAAVACPADANARRMLAASAPRPSAPAPPAVAAARDAATTSSAAAAGGAAVAGSAKAVRGTRGAKTGRAD